jgi:hypothetical protein
MKTYCVERNLAGVVTSYGSGLSYSVALTVKAWLRTNKNIHTYVKREVK